MKKIALSLAEAIIAVGVLGVVFAIALSVNRNFSSTLNTNIAIKKASQTLTDVVQEMLDDESYYGKTGNFSDMTEAQLSNGQVIRDDNITNKFKLLFKEKINLSKKIASDEVLLCPILGINNQVLEDEVCYMTQDGIVWGIPQTDFKEINVVNIQRRGYETAYVPITVYPNCDIGNADGAGRIFCRNSEEANTYFEENAVVFAIRQDGDIRPYSKVDCDNPQNEEMLQCRMIDIISNTSF